MLKVIIAYGLPASGKTTLLKKLKGEYHDFDSSSEQAEKVLPFISSVKEGVHIIDALFRNPNALVEYFFRYHPNDKLVIYTFRENIKKSLRLDMERILKGERVISCKNIITNMRITEVKAHKNLRRIKYSWRIK